MASVTTVSACFITPCSPTPRNSMFLAAGDIMWRWYPYSRCILFFKLQQPADLSSYVARLKSSLAMALVDFFPFAGRLFEQPDGRLALDCNDAGVVFLQSSLDIPFSSLEADGFQHQPFFDHLAPHREDLSWRPELPLLSVQVTRFPRDDQGFVLGIGANHAVGDGRSLWHFMTSWAECARGRPISVRPMHMRDALAPEKLILPPSGGAAPLEGQAEGAAKSLTQGGEIHRRPDTANVVQRDFHFSAEMVKKLKDMAICSASPGVHAISSFQALSAHVWRHLQAAADASSSSKSATSVLTVLADMRPRCVPPLPVGYFGNAVLGGTVVAQTEELQEESIGRTATRIQEVIKSLDDRGLKGFLGYLEVLDPNKLFAQPSQPGLSTFSVANSPQFPVYDVDFGWGRPLSVRPPRVSTAGKIMYYAGREGGGSVDVSVGLRGAVMEKLEQDAGFLS